MTKDELIDAVRALGMTNIEVSFKPLENFKQVTLSYRSAGLDKAVAVGVVSDEPDQTAYFDLYTWVVECG